jgi:homoserine kinase
MSQGITVRVPASSANLGPGFDVLAAALALYVEVDVEHTGRFGVETELSIAKDRRNLCVRGFEKLLDPGPFQFRIRSDVPLSGGLGTSAAATVAGLVAAAQLTGETRDLLPIAAAQEGHPDNAAAALHGGFVVCTADGVARIPVPAGLEAVLVIPHAAVRTKEARRALPDAVPLADAAYNVGQASMLVLGLARGDLELVARGLGDRLHQPHRAHLYPQTAEFVGRAGEFGALGATVSGAGPTVLLWVDSDAAEDVRSRAAAAAAEWADVLHVPFEDGGAA